MIHLTIATIYNGSAANLEEFADYARRYARAHSYHHYTTTSRWGPPGTRPNIQKLWLLSWLLDEHRLVWAIDADTIVNPAAGPVTDLVTDRADYALAKDDNGPNYGSVIYRSTHATRGVIRIALTLAKDNPQITSEQAAIKHALTHTGNPPVIQILPRAAINADPAHFDPQTIAWHWPGRSTNPEQRHADMLAFTERNNALTANRTLVI